MGPIRAFVGGAPVAHPRVDELVDGDLIVAADQVTNLVPLLRCPQIGLAKARCL